MKTSALPMVAVAAFALSAAGCSNWMDGSQQSRPAAATRTGTAQAAPTTPPALSPQMVREVQSSLDAKGYHIGVDGVYGATTQAAVEQFQRSRSLAPRGQVDSQTLAALGLAPGGTESGRQYIPTAQRAGGAAMTAPQRRLAMEENVSPGMIRTIQQNLDRRGYTVGKVDGLWGPRTRSALMAFQRDQNLHASGRIDQPTLAALGVDAQTQQTGRLPPDRRQAPTNQPPEKAPPPRPGEPR